MSMVGSRRAASVLVVSDPVDEDGTVPVSTQAVVTAALEWCAAKGDAENQCVLLCNRAPTVLPEGVTHVVPTANDDKVVETAATAVSLATQEHKPNIVMGSATKWGSSVIPRAAALLQVAPLADVISIVDSSKFFGFFSSVQALSTQCFILDSFFPFHSLTIYLHILFCCSIETFIRPMYAGNALAKVQTSASDNDKPIVLTVRPTAFEKAALTDETTAAGIPQTPLTVPSYGKSTWLSQSTSNASGGGRPDLAAARIVVSGGRGVGSAENFATVIGPLADAFGDAAVGASRAAVDAGMAPNDAQVGQTGKVVAPDLYIAAGISGAIQHISGMKDAKTIVAINKDPDAPIFQVADYSLVQDLFVAVPELTQKVRKE
jgi:electron transfer flavoprotein alpha subunit